jgi:hypothetical protein
VDKSEHSRKTASTNHHKKTGNMEEYPQCSYSLHKAIKQATPRYRDKVESRFNGSDTRRMWQDLQTIKDYKRKTSHVADTNVLLPDRLNTFFARFEDNTVPPTRPATKNCGFSLGVADIRPLSMLTLTRLPAQMVSLAVSSEHAQTSLLLCSQIYSISPYPRLLPHMLQDGHHCPYI